MVADIFEEFEPPSKYFLATFLYKNAFHLLFSNKNASLKVEHLSSWKQHVGHQ